MLGLGRLFQVRAATTVFGRTPNAGMNCVIKRCAYRGFNPSSSIPIRYDRYDIRKPEAARDAIVMHSWFAVTPSAISDCGNGIGLEANRRISAFQSLTEYYRSIAQLARTSHWVPEAALNQ